MIKDLIIFGASGCARELIWTIEDINQEKKKWNIIGLLDDRPEKWGKEVYDYPILNPNEFLSDKMRNCYIANGIGSCSLKYEVRKRFSSANFRYATLIHPSVILSKRTDLDGEGIIIQAGSIIGPDTKIKSYVTINTGVTIHHDSFINEFCTVAPGVQIAGFVSVGFATDIGIGTAVKDRISIGRECVIGANASVVHDIPDYSVSVGVPARIIRTNRLNLS